MVEETNSKYKNVMSGQVRRSKIVGQVLMLHSCSTCTLIIIKPIICIQVVVLGEGGGGGGSSRHPGCTTVHGLGHWVWES